MQAGVALPAEIDDEIDLPEDQQEDLADLELTEDWFAGPSLWGTDWTTETIVNQLRRGNINLNPRFQRRNAWDKQRKSLFVKSLILGLPVPQIILAERREGRVVLSSSTANSGYSHCGNSRRGRKGTISSNYG